MEWNANRLLRHQHEMQVILDMKEIDVCLISEKHFITHSFIKFNNYHVCNTVHPDNGAQGGSAVIIKKNIKH